LVTDLTSIGTLFAFVLVCGGVLYLPKDEKPTQKRFRIPYVNGKFIIPILVVVLAWFFSDFIGSKLTFSEGWESWKHHIPFYLFLIICVGSAILSFKNNFSSIPVLGLISCFYLMTEIPVKNWLVFSIWLVVGLSIYFGYSYRRSKLNQPNNH
jgi:hypothetical protein